MRSGGFPCRYGDCEVRFAVLDQSSMPALLAASAQRTEHEVETHDYHHKRLEDVVKKTAYGGRGAKPTPTA